MNIFQKIFGRKKAQVPEPTDTQDHITRYYSNYDEDGRLLSRRGQVEYRTTMRFIERYLQPGMRVLEIGAGTGRYSLALARQGFDVTAIELVQHNIDVFRAKLRPEDKIDLQQGNALDLSRFADNSFDITLLFGPMYHLYTQEDRLWALNEALRVTKPGGLLFVAYVLSDMAILSSGIGPDGWFWRELKQGIFAQETYVHHCTPAALFQTYRREQIEALAEELPAERLHYVALNCAAHLLKDTLADMSEERFEIFMRYHDFLCERPDMAGMASHSLDILRKNP